MKDQLTLHFSDGSVIGAWEEFSLTDEYTDPLQPMHLTTSPPREKVQEYAQLLQKGEKVTAKINGVPQSTSLIETVKTKIAPEGGVTFTISGKSLLAPIYGGCVDPPDFTFRSKSDTPVSNVVLKIAAPYGLTKLVGDERANRDAITGRPIGNQGPKLAVDALKHHEAQAHEGETAYGLISRIVTRLGICVRPSWDGVLMLSQPNYAQAPSYAVVQSFAQGVKGDYFVGAVHLDDTNEGQFSEARVRGQMPDRYHATRAARPTATFSAADLGDGTFLSYKSSVAPFKPKIILDKNARDRDRCTSVAMLALGHPARKAFTVTGEVAGFSATTGSVWNVDTIATVQLDALGIKADMWILEREFKQDRRGGQTTRLVLIPKGFLVLGEAPH